MRDIVSYGVVGIPYHIGYGTIFTGFLSPFIRHIDDPFAVSGNPTIDYVKTYRSRRHEQSIPPPMKNERHMPGVIF